MFYFHHGLEIFLYSTTSKQPLGYTKPPIQWVPVALSRGVKRPARETDHSSPSSADVNNDGAIPPLPHMSSCRRGNFTFSDESSSSKAGNLKFVRVNTN
jgi:hypothetical protein